MYLRYFGKFIYLYDLPNEYTKKLNFISKCDVTDIKLAKIDCHFSMFYVKSRRKETSAFGRNIREHFYVNLLSGQLIVLEDLKLTHFSYIHIERKKARN